MTTNKQVVSQINKITSFKGPLLYITRDKERALGLEDLLTNYKIITTSLPLDTAEIIEKKSLPPTFVLVFKNNSKIQRLSKKKKLKLLNPDYHLNEKYENKISQYQWLKTVIPQNLPKTIITTPAKTCFRKLQAQLKLPFICQFNRSHSGQGTFLISCLKDWQNLLKKFPKREIKCAKLIRGETITINICVWPAGHGYAQASAGEKTCILVGNPNYQITGIKQLTDFAFSTVGNDWSLAKKILLKNDIKTINHLSKKIGQAMGQTGWKGLFGLDFIQEKNKWLVIEINARQPASVGLETILQRKAGQGITIFTAHLAALLNLPLPGTCSQVQNSFQKINQGSQIIIRKKINQNHAKFQKSFYKSHKQTVSKRLLMGPGPRSGPRPKHNAELFRIQNLKTGFIAKNGQLNTWAKQILKNLK